MAGEDDRQRVLTVRGADGARGRRAEPQPSRLLAVAHGLPVRDRREGKPAFALEVGAVQIERDIECRQLAREVRLELVSRVVEHCTGVGRCRPPRPPQDTGEPRIRSDQPEPPDRRVDGTLGHYAAETASASSRGNRRETICETPSPPIVTPYRMSAASIVRFWCVMTTNCARSEYCRRSATKRPMFVSSSAASTSSSK